MSGGKSSKVLLDKGLVTKLHKLCIVAKCTRSSCPVHDPVRGVLEGPDAIFCEILMLVLGFTHVIPALVHPEDVDNFCRHLRFGTIAYRAVHGSPFADVLLQ